MLDAAKLADELRNEQENAQILEKDRREQEARSKDLQVGNLTKDYWSTCITDNIYVYG